jgi:outer membrane protein assembly factor BamB
MYAYDAAGTSNCSTTLKTCSPLWVSPLLNGSVKSSPVVVNGIVYIAPGYGDVYSFTSSTGNANTCSVENGLNVCQPLADFGGTHGDMNSSPAVSNGVLYEGSANPAGGPPPVPPSLYAWNTGMTGCAQNMSNTEDLTEYFCQPLWSAPDGGGGSSPAVANGHVYIGGDLTTSLYVFAAGTGTDASCSGTPIVCSPLWTAPTQGGILGSPAVTGTTVYLGSNGDKLYAFDAGGSTNCSGIPKTCSPLWTAATGGSIRSTPSIANSVIYIASEDFKVYAFDAGGSSSCSGIPKTCTPLWTGTMGGTAGDHLLSSAVVTDGAVWAGSDNGVSYAWSLP